MKTPCIRSLLAALVCALTVTTAHAQAASKTETTEGIVKLADSSIQYFSRGEGEAIVLLPGGLSWSVTWTTWRRHSPRQGTV